MSGNKSAQKRERTAAKHRVANRAVKSELRTSLTRARGAVSSGDADAAEAVKGVTSTLDRAAKKGVIHANNAARRKSRLAKQANQTAGK